MNTNPPQTIPFTKEGLAKLEEEFKELTDGRQEILIRLQTAREMGDLSENGAYTAARFELGATDRRLRHLRYLLRFGKVYEGKASGTIGFGNSVTLACDGKQLSYTLVGKFESDPENTNSQSIALSANPSWENGWEKRRSFPPPQEREPTAW
mgnify:CR=1 FL=1